MEEYLKELDSISKKLITLTELKEVSDLRDSLLTLSSYKARVNDMIPNLQYLYDTKLGEVYNQNCDKTATQLRYIVEYEMRNESRLLKIAERINSTIDLQSKNVITVVSSLKYEMANG